MFLLPYKTRFAIRLALVAASLGVALIAPTAQAGLGEPVESVATDHKILHAKALTVTPGVSYDVHESLLKDGTSVRQFASHAGTVFAVAWSGRTTPDLSVLLGTHFTAYVKAAKARHGSHHVLSVSTPDLNISIVKFLRSATGSAYLPAIVPAGTSLKALH